MRFAVEGQLNAVQCSSELAGKSQSIFPPKAAPCLQGDFGKLFCHLLHKTEIMTMISLYKELCYLWPQRLAKEVISINGIDENWALGPYQTIWSQLPPPLKSVPCSIPDLPLCTAAKSPFIVWLFCDVHKLRDVLADQLYFSWKLAIIKSDKEVISNLPFQKLRNSSNVLLLVWNAPY